MTSSPLTQSIPRAFVWRKLHSLMGLWLVIFLFFHLLTNSQAALFIGDDGIGFIRSVNSINELPYLKILEFVVLAVPILIHMLWGIKYLRTASYNSFGLGGGAKPYLPEYPRNHAYTWQRITSWLLIVGIIGHVIHMRFIEYPVSAKLENEKVYLVKISEDDGLYTLADRLGVRLYDAKEIAKLKPNLLPINGSDSNSFPLEARKNKRVIFSNMTLLFSEPGVRASREKIISNLTAFIGSKLGLKDSAEKEEHSTKEVNARSSIDQQRRLQDRLWMEALKKRPLEKGEIIAAAKDFGTAELLMVRNIFKIPMMMALYTLLVLFTCFHAFNGAWTFMIAWGVTLTQRSQKLMRTFSTFLMILVSALGLAAIWLTYWVNLKH